MLGCGVALGAKVFAGGSVASGAVMVLFFIAAVVLSPRAFPRSLTDAQARESSARDGRPIVYWRPGCAYCLRLRVRLGRRARRLHWVDIWRDPAGAAAVRAVNDGNETVPTVFVAGQAHVNPAPEWVREQVLRFR